MIREANAYTGEPGFRLHRDYGNASHVLGDADSDACDVAIPLGSKETSIGASIGIALYPQHARVSEALISLADDAMYQVKKKGKNDFFFATAEK